MATCEKLTRKNCPTLTFSVPDFLVRVSLLPDEDLASKIQEELSSLKLPESLQRNGLHFYSWRMSPDCYRMTAAGRLLPSSPRLLKWGTVDEFRFIFTSPTFTTEKAPKEKREFYIPRLNRERSLYGTEFEVKLRNELTQKAIAKECADWIKSKATFKSNKTNENMMGFITTENTSYSPVNGFTTVDLGCERGNNAYTMIQKADAPFSNAYIELFETLWNDKSKLQEVTDEVVDSITAAYNENSPDFIYFVTLYNIFNEFLEDVSEDVLPNEATGFKNILDNYEKLSEKYQRMLLLLSSTSSKSSMAASLQTALVSVKLLQRLL